MQQVDPCCFSPFQILNTVPENGSQVTQVSFQSYNEPYFTLESSPAMADNFVYDSPSAVSISSNRTPFSPQGSQSYLSEPQQSSDNAYGSPGSGCSVIEDGSELSHILRDLANELLGPESCGDDNQAYFSASSNQMMEVDSISDLNQVLIACAEAISDEDMQTAAKLMDVLESRVSVVGEPIERLGAYMLEGLKARLLSSGSLIYKKLKCKEPTGPELMSYMHVLYQICPYYKFAYNSSNAVIWEAMENEDRIHIIDFQIAQGSQWMSLIEVLAKRPGGAPCIRITGVDDSESAYARGGGLDLMGQRLSNFALSLGVPFEFHSAAISGCEVELDNLRIQRGEALAVNFPYVLHHMPDESVTTRNHRDRLLRLVKSLSPKVVTLIELESNTNTAAFLPRFKETLDYYTAMFESIDAARPRDDKQRMSAEEHCVARDVVNIIACEGAERVERHEPFGKWRSRLMMAGFTPCRLSPSSSFSIQDILKEYSKNYRVEERDGVLYLCWKNRVLSTSSAWSAIWTKNWLEELSSVSSSTRPDDEYLAVKYAILSLVSRQFVDMSRIRIEGLLAAFPKLVGTGKQHTYVETENVRYVYQPIDLLYLLLVTNKQSNILEDLDTLRLLSKLVPEYCGSLDEEGICKTAFELIFAFDEVISLGHRENVTGAQVKQYCEMESHEERLHKLVMQSKINETKDVMKRKANEIDKSKIEKNRGEKGGFMSLQSMGSMGSGRVDSGFGSEMSISSSGTGFGSGSGFGLSTDVDSSFSKSKGRAPSSATAPPKGLGMQLGKSQRANQFLESLKAEGEVILEDVRPSAGSSRSAAPPPTDPITLSVEEKLNVTLKRDGGVSNFDVRGTLSLQILNQEDGFIQVQIETGGNSGILFLPHPNINKELFSNENILGLKDPNRPFPTGQAGDGVGLLRWRMQSVDESVVPLTINCWPSVSGNETYVSIEYEASATFDLQNVVISVPLPALREAPNVRQVDGEWRYDSRNSILEWSILLIDNSNRSGSMEFVVPPADSSVFFPISVRFTAANTFSDLKVCPLLSIVSHDRLAPERWTVSKVRSEDNPIHGELPSGVTYCLIKCQQIGH
ncbi:hypothetical protein RHGRI_004232 [Rhododendron griersonianum]|uniref:Coatomer subunit delta n=1 Tax=Rhododendron griersonianum TaxID=479676 RepID=A0AAV6L7X0_9ERIC|nr:hypothetical protein RHGRI_004232 [Rhododendron griersonianum]